MALCYNDAWWSLKKRRWIWSANWSHFVSRISSRALEETFSLRDVQKSILDATFRSNQSSPAEQMLFGEHSRDTGTWAQPRSRALPSKALR